ncbi:flagellar transcriptional regulator FlhD [Tatumella sp. TA1]|uniref:flagellar transcriptional regulator FlhD n=1 Tax=Rosenbergiella collisarenosi TaxID=1544695 RepID=UPI0008F8B3F4|nr:flagellar transcriptional regulator FlhD [Rosenbergiella collisarenosi]MBT0720757.1 flagellar transcriptional regulator FlhD [Rosenbergiella collisarenosi]QGX91298.1 flagellar transcriptional regulator FlhD [Tatumella sp. TA1]
MDNSDIVKQIYGINLSYLLLAQRMLKEDKYSAFYRLGIEESLAEKIMELSLHELVKLAETNQFICKLRFKHTDIIEKLTQESRVDDLQQIHTGIILASDLLNVRTSGKRLRQ